MLLRRPRRSLLLFFMSLLCYKYCPQTFQDVTNDSRSLAEGVVSSAQETIRNAVRSHLDGDSQPGPSNEDTLQLRLQRLQTFLDDFIHQEATGRDQVLRVRTAEHHPPPNRLSTATHPSLPDNTSLGLCASLAGKRISMIGGNHVYLLHKHFLQDRGRVENRTFHCMHREFCTHHHICLPPRSATSFSRPQLEPTARYVRSPTTQQLVETESALVNYILSDTLFASPGGLSWQYSVPFFEPDNGIRSHETFWLASARKAAILIVGRGPLSAPGHTYSGNWSFLDDIPDYLGTTRDGKRETSTFNMTPRPLRLANAAVHFTLTDFFPDILQVLKSIREEVHPEKGKKLLWAGCWYRLPGRGPARNVLLHRPVPRLKDTLLGLWRRSAPHSEQVELVSQLRMLLGSEAVGPELEDYWTLYYNIQVFLQNLLLKELLPHYGLIFLPLNIPWSAYVMHHKFSCLRHTPSIDARCISKVELARNEAIGGAFLDELRHILLD